MRYLLDTGTFSAIARGTNATLKDVVRWHEMATVAVSLITVGEIRFGQAARPLFRRMAARIDELPRAFRCLPLVDRVIPNCAARRARLQRLGTPIGGNDNWIAAPALAEGLSLVSGHERAFKRVPGLKVENWLR